MDIRHQQRIKIVQELYAQSFKTDVKDIPNIFTNKTKKIIKEADKLNEHIQKFASKFPVGKIAKIDLAILQLAVYELIYEKKQPPKVIINEAVELAKEFGSERSFAFINAILGKIYSQISIRVHKS